MERGGFIGRTLSEAMAIAGLGAGVISEADLEALRAAEAASEEVIEVVAYHKLCR